MYGLGLGSKYLVSALKGDQMVEAARSGSSMGCHWKAAPPHSCTGTPRCSAYHAASPLGSSALKNPPPIPVTFSMASPPVGLDCDAWTWIQRAPERQMPSGRDGKTRMSGAPGR